MTVSDLYDITSSYIELYNKRDEILFSEVYDDITMLEKFIDCEICSLRAGEGSCIEVFIKGV